MERTEVSGSSSPWEFITSWLTPKILFCVLNIVIGTIFVSSNLKTHTRQQQQQQDTNDHDEHYPFMELRRPPSLLQRVRSFDFSLFPAPAPHSSHTHQPESSPSLLQRVRSFDFPLFPAPAPHSRQTHQPEPSSSLIQRVRSFDFSLFPAPAPHSHQTHQPEPEPIAEPPPSLLQRVKSIKLSRLSSVSPPAQTHLAEQAADDRHEVNPIAAAKATEEEGDQIQPATTGEESKTASLGVDEEVDAKADDFINRFRQQLKLQRLESLLRYREMLKRAPSFSK